MGDRFAGFRPHRRLTALGAVVLLPLSAVVASSSVASPASAPIRSLSTAGADRVSTAPPPAIASTSADVLKVLPAGWTTVGGHTRVVVGTVKQRVAQVSAMTSHDVPLAALMAYKHAERSLARTAPGCHLSWTLLAAIGQVESDNGRYGGAVVLANGDVSPGIVGPVLNGVGGVGAIRDTDGGRYDGDAVWDRAVGPMQFIPGTWAGYGADGNGDGVRDPNNIADAALAAAGYLCAGGGDLSVKSQLRAAVMRYNHSVAYVNLVLSLARAYATGAATVIPNGHATHAAQPVGERRDTASRDKPTRERHPGDRGQQGTGGGGQGGHKPPGHKPPGDKPPGDGPGGHKPPGHKPPGHKPPGDKPPGDDPPGDGPGQNLPPTTHSPVHKPPTTTPPTKPGNSDPGSSDPGDGGTEQPLATGVLRTCKAGWCVDKLALDFGADADFSSRVGDLNADGRTRSLRRELRSLEGLTMTVVLAPPAEPATDDEPTADGGAAPDSTTSNSTTSNSNGSSGTTEPPADTPSTTEAVKPADPAIVVTVDADGIVLSINGVAYAAPAAPTS